MSFLNLVAKAAPYATLASGVVSGIASNRAAKEQGRAIDRATGLTERQFEQIRQDQEPFRLAGVSALERLLSENIGPLEETPDFRFARDQGLDAIGRMGSARGKRFSGQQFRGAADYATNIARQYAGDRRNVLSSIAGYGPVATGTTANAGMATGNTLANLALQRGDARTSSFAGPVNAFNSTLEDLITQAAINGKFG